MNVWLHALLSSAAVGLVVAFLRAATLGDVVQRYSERAQKSGARSGVSDVVDAMAREGKQASSGFARNLSEPAFWRIVQTGSKSLGHPSDVIGESRDEACTRRRMLGGILRRARGLRDIPAATALS